MCDNWHWCLSWQKKGYRTFTSCQKKDVSTLFQLFLIKTGLNDVKMWNWICANLCQLSHAAILCQIYPGIVLVLIFRFELFHYAVDGSQLSLVGENPNWRYGLKIGGIKPSRSHGKPYQPTFKTIWQVTRKG